MGTATEKAKIYQYSCSEMAGLNEQQLIDLLRQSPAPDHPVAWLYKTVRRRATNLARAEQRRAKHQRRAGEQRKPWFLPPDNLLDDTVDLESLLTKLPRLEREIVVARVWGDLSFGQIADLVNRSTSSVHRRYQRALVQLGRRRPSALPS